MFIPLRMRTKEKLVAYIKYLTSIRSKDELIRYLKYFRKEMLRRLNLPKYHIFTILHNGDLVSVVIPVWNRTVELKESIDSILKQSYKNIELLIVTDGSPKETIEVIKKYEDNPRVKIFYYYNNSGNAVRGRNKAIREANGRYFAFHDSDDIADKNRILNSLKYIKKFNVDGVYGGWRAKLDGTRKDTGLVNNQEVYSEDCDFETMKKICVPCQSTVMIKTDVLRKLGGLKTSMMYREDHELWLRFMYNGYKFKAIPKILTNLKLHSNNAELLFKKDDKFWFDKLQCEYKNSNKLKEKIAYLIPNTTVSGGVAVVIQHANRLLQRGYDVMLISLDDKTEIMWTKCNVPIVPFHCKDKYYFKNIDLLVATAWSTVQYLEEIDSKRKLYFVQSDERRFFEKKDVGFIKQVHETYKTNCEFLTEAIWIQRWLKEEFNKDAYYVPNGLDKEIFFKTKPLKVRKGKMRILIEGAINLWFKGVVDAYYSVKDLNCEIWIVSSMGTPPTYWKYDKFFENVPNDKMHTIYSSCDVLLKLTRVEGFFGPPLEAMACGCIPIVSDVTGYDEYIKDGYNALVVGIGDTEGAKMAVKKLMEDKALRAKLIKNGFETSQRWSWDRSIDLLEEVIKGKEPKKYYTKNFPRRYSYKKEIKRIYGS